MLRRVSYLCTSRAHLEGALWPLTSLPRLRALELVTGNLQLAPEQLRVLGMLPLAELRLDSYAYKQRPGLPRPQFSHLDNEGVRVLVDAICARMRTAAAGAMASAAQAQVPPARFAGDAGAAAGGSGPAGAPAASAETAWTQLMQPMKLSLCGATALSHEAVSALLRLPVLVDLDIGGCAKITAMDKMRLVAKVKAGRELLECAIATAAHSGRAGPGGASAAMQRALRFPGLQL
jgi:hypothetical protein